MTVDTVITGGQLVQPDGILDASIAIADEKIVAIGSESELPAADQEINASGKLVLPGAVDVHVHLDDMFSNDTYETASKAAALGGTTTFVDFAWQAWIGEASIFDEERPDYAEAMAADDAIRMAMEAGCRYYGIHTTCRKAAEVIEDYRADNHDMIRAETCTQYTVADDSLFETLGLLPMAAPPLRKPDDNEAMFEHLDNGTLDIVSTDHCGYTREQKQVYPWWNGTFGMNSLQRSLPVFHDEAIINRDFSYPFLVQKLAANPARIFGLANKGTLDPGTDADIVVFDPDNTQPIDAADNASIANFSVYEGREVGSVEKTFVRGELIADEGNIVGEPGYGRFVERDIPTWAN